MLTARPWLEASEHLAKVLLWRRKLSRRCSQTRAEEHKRDPRSQLGWNDTELVPHAGPPESHIVYLGDTHHFAHRHECFTSPAIHLGLQCRSECTADLQMQILEEQMMNVDSWSRGISGGTPCPGLSILQSIKHTCVQVLMFTGNHPSRQQHFDNYTLLNLNWKDSVQQQHLVNMSSQWRCCPSLTPAAGAAWAVLSNTRGSSALIVKLVHRFSRLLVKWRELAEFSSKQPNKIRPWLLLSPQSIWQIWPNDPEVENLNVAENFPEIFPVALAVQTFGDQPDYLKHMATTLPEIIWAVGKRWDS